MDKANWGLEIRRKQTDHEIRKRNEPKYVQTHTPWSRFFPAKLTGPHQVKNSRYFIEPEGSLPNLQASATCPCPEPQRFSPILHIPLFSDPF